MKVIFDNENERNHFMREFNGNDTQYVKDLILRGITEGDDDSEDTALSKYAEDLHDKLDEIRRDFEIEFDVLDKEIPPKKKKQRKKLDSLKDDAKTRLDAMDEEIQEFAKGTD